jgi:hypothetical protein
MLKTFPERRIVHSNFSPPQSTNEDIFSMFLSDSGVEDEEIDGKVLMIQESIHPRIE